MKQILQHVLSPCRFIATKQYILILHERERFNKLCDERHIGYFFNNNLTERAIITSLKLSVFDENFLKVYIHLEYRNTFDICLFEMYVYSLYKIKYTFIKKRRFVEPME